MSKCRSCGAPIEWATFATSGKRAPFDVDEQLARPSESRWALESDTDVDGEQRYYAHRVTTGERGVTCHFSTCPDGDRWRK